MCRRTEFKNLRKEKVNALYQKEKVLEKKKEWEEKVDEQNERNKESEKEIKYEEYKQELNKSKALQKIFEDQRDDLENQYHKLIEEGIRRERLVRHQMQIMMVAIYLKVHLKVTTRRNLKI